MPHIFRVDATRPESLYQALKDVDVSEGTEFEVEEQGEGFFLRPIPPETSSQHPRTGREIIATLEQNLSRIRESIPADSPDLDSDWWIRTIQEAKTTKDLSVELE